MPHDDHDATAIYHDVDPKDPYHDHHLACTINLVDHLHYGPADDSKGHHFHTAPGVQWAIDILDKLADL